MVGVAISGGTALGRSCGSTLCVSVSVCPAEHPAVCLCVRPSTWLCRLRASCTGLYIVLRSLRRPPSMVRAPYVALLLTVARYGFPSGNDASPSLPNSSHVVAPSHAADAASGGGNMTAFPSVLDPSGRSHSSPPSSPRCSVVEPTAGIAVNRSATSSDHPVAQVGHYLCNSGVGSATFFDVTLSKLVHEYGYSNESLLTWSATRLNYYSCGRALASAAVYDSCGRDLASAALYYSCGRALASAVLYDSCGRALASAALASLDDVTDVCMCGRDLASTALASALAGIPSYGRTLARAALTLPAPSICHRISC